MLNNKSQVSRFFDVLGDYTSDAFFSSQNVDISPSTSSLPKLTVLTSEPSNQSTLSSQPSDQIIHLTLKDITILPDSNVCTPGSDSLYSLQVNKSQSSTLKFPESDK